MIRELFDFHIFVDGLNMHHLTSSTRVSLVSKTFTWTGGQRVFMDVDNPLIESSGLHALGPPYVYTVVSRTGTESFRGLINYVYDFSCSKRKANLTALEDALVQAMSNPIERTIRRSGRQIVKGRRLVYLSPALSEITVPHMREDSVRSRVHALLNLDWKTLFHIRMAWIDEGDFIKVSAAYARLCLIPSLNSPSNRSLRREYRQLWKQP